MTFTHAIILDIEATCDDLNPPRPQEIIEFPSVLLSLSTQATVDEFTAFVRPCHHPNLTEFCKSFTSIRQSDVNRAKSFAEVLAGHQTWLQRHRFNENNAVIVTCGDWDLSTMLPAQCLASEPSVEHIPPIYSRWHNIKHSYCLVTNRKKAPGMAGMMKELGLPLVGHHHRGIDDCRNIAVLCKTLLNGGAQLEITSELPPSKYPPITILLRLGDRVEETILSRRSVTALAGLAGNTFKSRILEFHRPDGTRIVQDEDLLFLTPGEVIQLRE